MRGGRGRRHLRNLGSYETRMMCALICAIDDVQFYRRAGGMAQG